MSRRDKPDVPSAKDDVEAPIPMQIDGTLDLHTFLPADVKNLLHDYLRECLCLGLLDVRVVHGKGTGALRRSVHAVLGRMPIVESFGLAGSGGGGWGATWVRLRTQVGPSTTVGDGQ